MNTFFIRKTPQNTFCFLAFKTCVIPVQFASVSKQEHRLSLSKKKKKQIFQGYFLFYQTVWTTLASVYLCTLKKPRENQFLFQKWTQIEITWNHSEINN